jgi:hypothetical protein
MEKIKNKGGKQKKTKEKSNGIKGSSSAKP